MEINTSLFTHQKAPGSGKRKATKVRHRHDRRYWYLSAWSLNGPEYRRATHLTRRALVLEWFWDLLEMALEKLETEVVSAVDGTTNRPTTTTTTIKQLIYVTYFYVFILSRHCRPQRKPATRQTVRAIRASRQTTKNNFKKSSLGAPEVQPSVWFGTVELLFFGGTFACGHLRGILRVVTSVPQSSRTRS